MTTEEFKQYLIKYFKKKHRYNINQIFRNEFKRQRYSRRNSIECDGHK